MASELNQFISSTIILDQKCAIKIGEIEVPEYILIQKYRQDLKSDLFKVQSEIEVKWFKDLIAKYVRINNSYKNDTFSDIEIKRGFEKFANYVVLYNIDKFVEVDELEPELKLQYDWIKDSINGNKKFDYDTILNPVVADDLVDSFLKVTSMRENILNSSKKDFLDKDLCAFKGEIPNPSIRTLTVGEFLELYYLNVEKVFITDTNSLLKAIHDSLIFKYQLKCMGMLKSKFNDVYFMEKENSYFNTLDTEYTIFRLLKTPEGNELLRDLYKKNLKEFMIPNSYSGLLIWSNEKDELIELYSIFKTNPLLDELSDVLKLCEKYKTVKVLDLDFSNYPEEIKYHLKQRAGNFEIGVMNRPILTENYYYTIFPIGIKSKKTLAFEESLGKFYHYINHFGLEYLKELVLNLDKNYYNLFLSNTTFKKSNFKFHEQYKKK